MLLFILNQSNETVAAKAMVERYGTISLSKQFNEPGPTKGTRVAAGDINYYVTSIKIGVWNGGGFLHCAVIRNMDLQFPADKVIPAENTVSS